jgi:hypothetical protein
MKRRNFIQLSLAMGTAILMPTWTYSKDLNLAEIQFSTGVHNTNQAQTIMIFQYGGASQLCGNLTNFSDFSPLSQSNYQDYFETITQTTNHCWAEAGGNHIESLLASGDMTLFRSCYSPVREETANKAHASCITQNQKGSFDEDNAGILSNLAEILEANGMVTENTIMPFITLEGESDYYRDGATPINSYLKPVALDENLNNPYRRYKRDWRYYTEEEQDIPLYYHAENGFDAPLHDTMDALAQSQNTAGKIKDAFAKRPSLDSFIETLTSISTPDLGSDSYLLENVFAKKVETAVNILANNSDSKVITISGGDLGSWDDHNKALEYVTRSESLFATLKSAMTHIKALGKEQTINIMVFGDFGRNVNLNASQGWDHGNLQNFYVLGGHGYFNHKGIVGETILGSTESNNRLYLKPKANTYTFEPMSIASTLYKIYGIENPETLTNDNAEISVLFS